MDSNMALDCKLIALEAIRSGNGRMIRGSDGLREMRPKKRWKG